MAPHSRSRGSSVKRSPRRSLSERSKKVLKNRGMVTRPYRGSKRSMNGHQYRSIHDPQPAAEPVESVSQSPPTQSAQSTPRHRVNPTASVYLDAYDNSVLMDTYVMAMDATIDFREEKRSLREVLNCLKFVDNDNIQSPEYNVLGTSYIISKQGSSFYQINSRDRRKERKFRPIPQGCDGIWTSAVDDNQSPDYSSMIGQVLRHVPLPRNKADFRGFYQFRIDSNGVTGGWKERFSQP